MTLANKYRPQDWDDVVEQPLIVNILKNMCDGELPNRNFLLIGPAGTGKAQPLYSKVLTTMGFIPMSEVKLGMSILDGRGKSCRVDGIFPQGKRPIYEINFVGGFPIRVSDEHINPVWWYSNAERNRKTSKNLTTTELLEFFNSSKKDIFVNIYSNTLNKQPKFRQIVSIKYIGDEECQCIRVTSPSHTYVTDNYVVTHNTTMGRIIAKKLNGCDGGITEIDAASHGSVEDARELVVQARTFPNGYKYKVFIIDEAHAASSNYWQAMLKVLEESPAKSVFCFCTTNPEKIPATILSRVQTFQLSKISLEGIYSRLVEVIKKENEEGNTITYEDDAIRFLAKLANGGMRDALTLLDKALVYSNNITSANLELSLGLPKYDDFFALLSAISKKDNESIINTVYKVYNSGVNFVKWFEDFHSFVINIVKYIFIKDINRTMIPAHYEEKISKYSTAHCSICLRLANLLMKMNGELKTSSYHQDLVLTYLCKLPKA